MKYSRISKQSGSVPSTENLPIYYDLYTPVTSSKSTLPVILFIHGFKGFKDWGAFPDACEELARQGFIVTAFNMSLNGVGENMLDFDEPEHFARQTLSQDLDDVGTVIDAIQKGSIVRGPVQPDTDRIGIIGHSRGGHTAVAAAAEYDPVQCLVTWSAVADYNARWSEEMIRDWNEKGFTEIKNARTGQVLNINKVVYDDALENADRLIAVERVKNLHIPSLFIAGKEDEAVPASDSKTLWKTCPARDKEFRLIAGAGHTFDVSHPFEEKEFPKPFSEVLNHTTDWLGEHLVQ